MIRVNEQFRSVIITVIEVAYYSEHTQYAVYQGSSLNENGIEVGLFVTPVEQKNHVNDLSPLVCASVPYLAAGIHRSGW